MSNNIFEKEKIGMLLFKLSIPVIITMLVSELYNMVDTIFVGNYVDPNGIGALAVVFPIQRIIIALSFMIGIGSSTAFTRARGAEDMDLAKRIITNGFTLVLLVMIPISILIYYKAEPILRFLGASDALLIYGIDYLTIIILGSVFLSATIFISNIMISLGKTSVSIMSTSIGTLLNLLIDYVLVKESGWGVKGAAIATTVSQIAGFIFAYSQLYQFKKSMKIKFGLNIRKSIVILILTVGVSAFIVEAEDGILMAVLNNLLQRYACDQSIVVLALSTKVYMFLFVTLFGMASGMQPIAAYNVGAKNYRRLGEVLKKTLIYAAMTTVLLWLFAMTFTPSIMRIFVKDPVIIKEAVFAFRVMILVFPLVSVYYISIFYFQSLGKAKQSIFMSLLRQIGLMIPISFVLVIIFDLKELGVWLSFPIADLIVMLVASFQLMKERKKLKHLYN